MAKFAEFLRSVNKELNSNELEALASSSAISELDIDDKVITLYKEKSSSAMTMDAVKNNPDVEKYFKEKMYNNIRGEILGNIDTQVISTAKKLFGEEKTKKLREAEFTKDKIKFFEELVLENSGGDDKQKIAIADLKKQLEEIDTIKQAEILKLTEKHKQDIDSFKGDISKKEFARIASSYNLADVYKKDLIKNSIINEAFNVVSNKADIRLNDNGDLSLYVKGNPELELYQGSKKVTINDMLDEQLKDYLIKNHVNGGAEPQKIQIPNGKEGTLQAIKLKQLADMQEKI